MARTRRPRLSWVRWFWSDFDGGTKLFNCAEKGQYVALLHLQLDSGSVQAIPDEPALLAHVVGELVSSRVLEKFDRCPQGLRNARLAAEMGQAIREYEGKSQRSNPADSGADTTPKPRTKNQEPEKRARSQETTSTERVLPRFTEVFKVAYSRPRVHVPTLNGKAQKHLRAMVSTYGDGGACCLPILAYFVDAVDTKRVRDRAVTDLLHDGTNGTFEWSKLLQKADSLSRGVATRALEVGERVGLSKALQELGVHV